MAIDRRSFLDKLGIISLTGFLGSLAKPARGRGIDMALRAARGRPADELAGDELFWQHIREAFTVTPDLIDLNNGGVSPSPKVVIEAMKRDLDLSNKAPSYYMWRILDKGREPLRKDIARIAGCSEEEIAIHRNTTEALETVIFGLPLKSGDEVVLSKQDYPNMINAWKQRERRDGIRLVWADLQLPSEDNGYLTEQYTRLFTDRTKLVHVTHVINWSGQIMPARQIADEAKKRGIEVLVDGAHSFAHFAYTIPSLNCDYFGTSLHKWLTACIGTGMLYVRREKIKALYPLFAAPDPTVDDIRKFEHQGTRPFFIEQAITEAIGFYEMIGAERKQERLLYLKNYWMQAVAGLPGVRLHTSLRPEFGCAIGLVSIDGKKPIDLESYLLYNYHIHTVAIEWENLHGLRVTPNVYTSTKDLDLLIRGIGEFARS